MENLKVKYKLTLLNNYRYPFTYMIGLFTVKALLL